jgi:hypothetical protein
VATSVACGGSPDPDDDSLVRAFVAFLFAALLIIVTRLVDHI